MAFAIAAAAVGNRGGPRRPNKRREPCSTEEDVRLATRLSQQEIDVVASEYNQWRSQRNGTRANVHASSCNMMQFVTYLARGGYFNCDTPHTRSSGVLCRNSTSVHFSAPARRVAGVVQAAE